MDLDIREAIASDYDAICQLFDEADALHRESLPWIFEQPSGVARTREYVLDLITDETVGFFVAQIRERLVGLICVLIRESPEMPIFVRRRYAQVDQVVVKEKFRRTGIGRALMEKAHDWAVAEAADSVELNVWEFNREAIEFYQRLGYETASRKMNKRLR